MRQFKLQRDLDVSGVSGTGVVAEGVIFSDGEAVVHWLGQYPTTTPHPKGIESIKAIHGHGGATRIVVGSAAGRLGRIAESHCMDVTEGGLTSGLCVECARPHPCPTYIWATTERDPLSTWDPDDDEVPEVQP